MTLETVKPIQKRCSYCMYPASLRETLGSIDKGKEIKCATCGSRYMSGCCLQSSGTVYHLIFRRGMGDRSVPSWHYLPRLRRVYVTCVCGPLLPIELKDVFDDGYVGGHDYSTCTVCDYCKLHFWPYLEGWKELRAKHKRLAEKARARRQAKKAKKAAETTPVVSAEPIPSIAQGVPNDPREPAPIP